MKVTFALRGDALAKPGGDTKKVDSLREELDKRPGVRSEIVYSPADLEATSSDVIHAVNLDLPLENLAFSRIAESKRVPFVLSTVHHPWAGIAVAYAESADRYFKPMRRLGLPASRAVLLREAGKLAARRQIGASWRAMEYGASAREAQRSLLSSCAAILPMCLSEQSGIGGDLGSPVRSWIVPNGATFEQTSRGVSEARTGLIVVGRIEPRKNSLEMARAAHGAGLSTTFIGALNNKHGAYVDQFLKLATASPFVMYRGLLNRSELREQLGRADVYVNPSWYEVVSQADIEAASSGCRVATTRYSYVGDFLPQAMRIDPGELASPRGPAVIQEVLAGAQVTQVAGRETWADVVDRLMACYEAVTG